MFVTGVAPFRKLTVWLQSVIALAKPKFLACDPTDNLRFYAAVTSGIDGYTALVSFAEFDPNVNGINQLLSLVENGASLSTIGAT